MNINIKDIIYTAISEKRDSYFKLKEHERRRLVSVLLQDSDQVLFDADNELVLRKAVAKAILHEGDPFYMTGIYHEINRLFITGDRKSDAYFQYKIDFLLHEEWMEQNASENEHFENDMIDRARDAQSAMHP